MHTKIRPSSPTGGLEIADKLSIEETTVKNHISNILSKLGANDRAHAVTLALRRGIIELDLPKR